MDCVESVIRDRVKFSIEHVRSTTTGNKVLVPDSLHHFLEAIFKIFNGVTNLPKQSKDMDAVVVRTLNNIAIEIPNRSVRSTKPCTNRLIC